MIKSLDKTVFIRGLFSVENCINATNDLLFVLTII